jgi:hypothetical protein
MKGRKRKERKNRRRKENRGSLGSCIFQKALKISLIWPRLRSENPNTP